MAKSSGGTAAGKSADIEVLIVPDLDKLLAGERQERPIEGEFATQDLVEQTGGTLTTIGRKLRAAIHKGLVEYVGMRPRQGIDGRFRPIQHYRMVGK